MTNISRDILVRRFVNRTLNIAQAPHKYSNFANRRLIYYLFYLTELKLISSQCASEYAFYEDKGGRFVFSLRKSAKTDSLMYITIIIIGVVKIFAKKAFVRQSCSASDLSLKYFMKLARLEQLDTFGM